MMDFNPMNIIATWPVKVTIYDVRNEGFVLKYDKGRATYDKEFDIPEYRLKKHKSKEPIRPPSLKYIVRDAKNKDTLTLVQIERNRFIPVLPPIQEGEDIWKLKAKTDEDVVVNMWNRTMRKKKAMTYIKKSFWDKWGTPISLAICGMIIIFTLIFTVQFLRKDLIETQRITANKMDNIAQKFEDATTVMQISSGQTSKEETRVLNSEPG